MVDRIVDHEHVVLLVGEEIEHVVPRALLPEAITEGIWLRVVFEGDRLVSAVIDSEATERVRKRIESKLNQLRRRGRPRS